MTLNPIVSTIDLVESDDDDVKFIGLGEKRKIIEIDLNEDLILGVADDCATLPKKRRKKGKTKKKNAETNDSDTISPAHWTPDMKKYYNRVTKKEINFSIDNAKDSLPRDQKLWDVGRVPRLFRKFNAVCFRCWKDGHQERKCPLRKCYLCGDDGHVVRDCPKRKCLTCGKITPRAYVMACSKCQHSRRERCSRCGLAGHNVVDCTDNWRRFHNSTTLGKVLPPFGKIYKNRENLWCCNCGRRGHVHERCRIQSSRILFPPTSTFVTSYDSEFANDPAEQDPNYGNDLCEYEITTFRDKTRPIQSPNRIKISTPNQRYFQEEHKPRHTDGRESGKKQSQQASRNVRKKLKEKAKRRAKNKKKRRDDPLVTEFRRNPSQKNKIHRSRASDERIQQWNNFLMGI